MWRLDVGLCVAVGAVGAADAVCAVVALMPLPLLRLASSVFGIVLQLLGWVTTISLNETGVMEQACAWHCCTVPQVATLGDPGGNFTVRHTNAASKKQKPTSHDGKG